MGDTAQMGRLKPLFAQSGVAALVGFFFFLLDAQLQKKIKNSLSSLEFTEHFVTMQRHQ